MIIRVDFLLIQEEQLNVSFAARICNGAVVVVSKKEKRIRLIKILQSFLCLLHQLLFPAGSVRKDARSPLLQFGIVISVRRPQRCPQPE